MIIKQCIISNSDSWDGTRMNEHSALLYVPEATCTKSEFNTAWDAMPSSSNTDYIRLLLASWGISNAGATTFFPAYYNGTLTSPTDFTNYGDLLLIAPYQSFVSPVSLVNTAGNCVNYRDADGNGLFFKKSSGIGLSLYGNSIFTFASSGYTTQLGIDENPSAGNSGRLHFLFVSSDNLVCLVRVAGSKRSSTYYWASASQSAQLIAWLKSLPDPIYDSDPYNDLPVAGDEPIPGGDSIPLPGFPQLNATSAGVIGLFCPSAAQMQLLSDFMWTDFGGTGSTVEDILKELVEAIKRTISNPLDYIIGLNIIPSQGLSIGTSKVVRFGFVSSGVSMPVLASQYFTVDCGALAFDTLCGNTFLDYAPYSKFSIYLPYIGFKDVDPNDFVGHTIGVVYHGDCVTGGITAYVTKDGSVMYQYSGCCALNVPLSADSWGETISGAISVATGIVAAAASGGAAGVGLAAAKGAASVAANPSLLSPQVSHSGAVSGGAGCMGVQYPFVIREAVNFHSTVNFNKESGYPAYYYKKFADVTGFTTVLDPHVGNIENATREELDEIERLLESGVIL